MPLDPALLAATRAFVFDAYGTLFDVHSAVARHAAAIGPDAPRLSEIWRAKQLEYSWVYSLTGRYERFFVLTERALDYAIARCPGVDPAVKPRLLDAYRTLSCFPEVPRTLETLRLQGFATGILSNGDPAMLDSAVQSAGIAPLLDRVLSVDEVRVFKTDRRVYELVPKAFGARPQEIVFVSSNRWDAAAAGAFGFKPVWVNRAALPDEYLDLPPVATLPDLSGLA
jgi:2-haloacid dehalogenase